MNNSIDSIMRTTMENLKEMVDVNTVVGTAVTAKDGTIIIPVSRVSFGFVAGGGEYTMDTGDKGAPKAEAMPFAGGAGAGVSVSPIGFLVVSPGNVRMLSAHVPSYLDRMIECLPSFVCEVKKAIECFVGPENGEKKTPPEDKPEDGAEYAL